MSVSNKIQEQSILTCTPLEREFYSLHKGLQSCFNVLNCLEVIALQKHVNISWFSEKFHPTLNEDMQKTTRAKYINLYTIGKTILRSTKKVV